MIEFDIKLARGQFALDASLKSEARVIGLFGPSGAGKSTLLNVLAGSIKPAQGKVVINGRCLLDTDSGIDIPMHQRRIGMVYQDGRLFPHMSVRNNLVYGMRLLPETARRYSLERITELLEIGPLLEQRPAQLSGGERQRVALGRALLASPDCLLMDEPMASLDVRLKSQILPFLRRVKEETAVPMIYVSHAMPEILDLTQQLAVMQDGRILSYGDYHEVLTSQAVLPLAHSLGIENVLVVTIAENHADLGHSVAILREHHLTLPLSQHEPGSRVPIAVPAAHIALAKSSVNGISIQNQLSGRITEIKLVGHRALISVDISTPLQVEVSEKSVRELGLETGQEIYCLIKTQSLRYLAGV